MGVAHFKGLGIEVTFNPMANMDLSNIKSITDEPGESEEELLFMSGTQPRK